VQLEGSIKSGEGELGVRGQSTLTGEATLRVTGTRVLAADIPGVKVVVTPELTVQRATGRTDLGGRITIPTADINLQRLPSARRTRSASPDVVVVDDPRRAEAVRSAPLYAQVDLQLGDAVKISGYGLDAAVTGQLGVRERPGEPTTASGELRVSGRYQAYGQDLTIQQGQLLFASTPLDNPRLAITAVREVDTVTAGFRVAGSARNPELTVFSDPAMGQSNALSYIIAGKPLDQIGAGTGEGDALQSAARQLGAAAGGLLAKNVGKRLGVDELGIKDSASIGGAALTVGQYLSPRLYLGYGIGLFDPGQVVTLRYKVSRSLAIEAEQGTLNSRAGIEFRKEK
jgi:translocation and assembly module TamB